MTKDFVSAKSTENQNVVNDLTKFLLKKDFLFSRFSNFNDQPETFATWKASVNEITEELHVTLFVYLKFVVPLENFHSYGDVAIAGEGLQILTYARHS